MDAGTDVAGLERDPWGVRLSEYLDGDLSARTRRKLERHLATCGACRAALEELRDLVMRARALDAPAEPDHDLWPAIQPRLAPMPVQVRRVMWPAVGAFRVVPRLATAAAVVVAGVAAALWLMSARDARERANPPAADVSGEAAAIDVDREYYDAVAGLRQLVQARLADDPQVVEVLERNLLVLDAAIAEYQDALVVQPGDAGLTGRIQAARQRKLRLLRQAAALAADGAN